MSTHESRSGLRPISVGDLSDELPSHGYPPEMVEIIEAANGQPVTVRPILPLDAAKFQAFVRNLSDASRSNRFLHGLKELSGQMLQRLTRIDYRTHMALVAEIMREAPALALMLPEGKKRSSSDLLRLSRRSAKDQKLLSRA